MHSHTNYMAHVTSGDLLYARTRAPAHAHKRIRPKIIECVTTRALTRVVREHEKYVALACSMFTANLKRIGS
jgi:hypothetical protein